MFRGCYFVWMDARSKRICMRLISILHGPTNIIHNVHVCPWQPQFYRLNKFGKKCENHSSNLVFFRFLLLTKQRADSTPCLSVIDCSFIFFFESNWQHGRIQIFCRIDCRHMWFVVKSIFNMWCDASIWWRRSDDWRLEYPWHFRIAAPLDMIFAFLHFDWHHPSN